MFVQNDMQIRLKFLATMFHTSTCSCAENELTDESAIAWSKSRQLLQHHSVKRWLDKCLQYHPCCRPTHVQAHPASTPSRCNKIKAPGTTPTPALSFQQKIGRLLAGCTPALQSHNVIQWIEDKRSLRYIRLALEDGCKSCIRHPSLEARHANNATHATGASNSCL